MSYLVSKRRKRRIGMGANASVYQTVRAAADRVRGLSVTPINPGLTVTPIHPNLRVTPINGYTDCGFRQPMGDLLSSIESAAGAGAEIATDPYLSETVCHIQQLAQIRAGQGVQACAQTAAGLPGGIGLDALQTPLRAYVYAKQNVWAIPLAIAVAFGIPFLLGYEMGEK